MGLQKHIAQETALHIVDRLCTYIPLAIPISKPSTTHRRFRVSNTAVKILLFYIAVHLNSEHIVTDQGMAEAMLSDIKPYQHILDKCGALDRIRAPAIPLYHICWFKTIFDALNVWRSPAYLCSRFNVPLSSEWEVLQFVGDKNIYCGVWEDWCEGSVPVVSTPVLLLVSDENVTHVQSTFPDSTTHCHFPIQKNAVPRYHFTAPVAPNLGF